MTGKRKLDYDAIIADLKSGMPRKEVAKKHGCSPWSVDRIAKENDLTPTYEGMLLKRDMEDADRYEKDVAKRWEEAVAPLRKAKNEREMRFNRANRLDISDMRKRRSSLCQCPERPEYTPETRRRQPEPAGVRVRTARGRGG